MTRTIRRGALTLGLIAAGCGGDADAADDGPPPVVPRPTSSGSDSGGLSGPPPATTNGPRPIVQTRSCRNYVACAAAVMDPGLADIDQTYGGMGTCWMGSESEADACDAECGSALDTLVDDRTMAGDPVPEQCTPPLTFSDLQDLFRADCVRDCHEPGGEFDQLDLSGSSYFELIMVAAEGGPLFFVVPGDSDASYLWHKVAGTHGSVGGSGGRMPQNGDPWSQRDIDALAEWIDNGAQQ